MQDKMYHWTDIRFDPDVDAAYLKVANGPAKHTKEVFDSGGLLGLVDTDEYGIVVGYEVIGVSTVNEAFFALSVIADVEFE